MTSLTGRIAFVAGATGTIGRAVCRVLAAEGAEIVVHCRGRLQEARALADSLPTRAVAVAADLADAAQLTDAIAWAERELGAATILVDTVHPGQDVSPVAELDADTLTRQFEGVLAYQALLAGFVPRMRNAGWGRIVYVAGALMARPAHGFGAYGSAKAAAATLTRYLALEEGGNGITANIVAPGRVVDPDDDSELGAHHAALAEKLLQNMALGEFPSPDDVARAVCTLVVQSAVTAQTVWVTGGEPIAA